MPGSHSPKTCPLLLLGRVGADDSFLLQFIHLLPGKTRELSVDISVVLPRTGGGPADGPGCPGKPAKHPHL